MAVVGGSGSPGYATIDTADITIGPEHIAKRRRRVISFSHVRELALAALYNAEAKRIRSAEEEALRTSAYEALA